MYTNTVRDGRQKQNRLPLHARVTQFNYIY